MLLPRDTYRKRITFITAVLLPFVTYLLTTMRNSEVRCSKFDVVGIVLVAIMYKHEYVYHRIVQLLIYNSY
jgi:hypothetical protein